MRLEKAAGALGAFVLDVQVADAIGSASLFESIRAALLEHQVLFFRDQRMTPQQQRAFAVRFGPIEGHPAYEVVAGTSDVQILESTKEKPSKIGIAREYVRLLDEVPTETLTKAQTVRARELLEILDGILRLPKVADIRETVFASLETGGT